jgi:hypothetical protein
MRYIGRTSLVACILLAARLATADVSESVWEAMKDKVIILVFKDFKEVTGTLTKITPTEVVMVLENGVVQSYAKTEVEQVKVPKSESIGEKKSEAVVAPKDLVTLCSLYAGDDSINLTESQNGSSFGSTDANDVVGKMAKAIGMLSVPPAFEASVANAAATYYNGQRVIVYNNKFMDELSRAVGTEWSYKAVLAHELGHHMNFHVGVKSTADSWKQELEADYFMGFAMAKMGATLEQAQSAMKGLELMYGGSASKTHPASKDRLASTKTGYCNAKGGCLSSDPAPTPSPTPAPTPAAPKPETAPSDLIVGKVTGGLFPDEVYYSNAVFPKPLIDEGWEKGYNITNLSYINKKWHLTMSSGTGWVQNYKTDYSFPNEYVKENWSKGYKITSMSYGGLVWSIVMSKNTNISEQKIVADAIFPAEKIKSYWDLGYRIGLVAYSDSTTWSGWVVTMEKGRYAGQQTYNLDDTLYFAFDFVEKKMKEGYYSTSFYYGGDKWISVMTKEAGCSNQSFSLVGDVKTNWSLGRNISSISYGDGQLVFVFSKYYYKYY